MLSYILKSLLISSLFICSFGEVSNLSRQSVHVANNYFPITLNQANAGFNYSNCMNKFDDKEVCDNFKKGYEDVFSDKKLVFVMMDELVFGASVKRNSMPV